MDVNSVVWASARGDIFWPGQVMETHKDDSAPSKQSFAVHFFIEDSYENIKNRSKLFPWNCEKQNKFIENGRALKCPERKVEFNKAVAKADRLFMLQENRGANMSLNGHNLPVNSSTETRKGAKRKSRGPTGGQGCSLRKSPRTKLTNNKHTTAITERGLEDKRSKVPVYQPSTNDKRTTANTERRLEDRRAKDPVYRSSTIDKQMTANAERGLEDKRSKVPVYQPSTNDKQTTENTERGLEDKRSKVQVCPPSTQTNGQTTESVQSHDLSSKRTLTTCNSQNGSIVTDDSSDDELLSDLFSPSQESNQFSVDDIVWAKYYREPYWPALVKRVVTGKRKSEKKYLVRFLGWHKCLFKIQPKKLAHFGCDQRTEFLSVKGTLKDKELEDLFDEALVQAEDLLNRKGLGKSLDDEIDEGDLEIFEETAEDDVDNNGGEDGGQTKDKDLPQQTSSLFECRKSLRAKKQVSKYSNMLSYIRQAKPILKQILNGDKPSERHTIYTHGRVSERDHLKRRAGFGPIADENLRDDIMSLLLGFYKEIKGSPNITYVSDVWLPEAIIYSIQQMDHVDKQKAEKIFMDGSKYAVTSAEVQELTAKFKKRKLSLEEKEERVRIAERAVARHSACES